MAADKAMRALSDPSVVRVRRVLPAVLVVLTLPAYGGAATLEGTGWPALPPPGVIRLAHVSDAQAEGDRLPLRRALDLAEAQGAHVVLYGGDTNYDHRDAPADWLDALGAYREPGRLLFVYGNHDGGGGFAPYVPAPPGRTWWNWTRDGVAVVGLDTNADLSEGSPQTAWLETVLEAHRDEVVVVMMHIPWWVPPYPGSVLPFRGNASAMEDRALRHGVDLVLGGHHHYYARHEAGGVPHVINSAIDAHIRRPTGEVRERALVTHSVPTIVLLDASPCGIDARVLSDANETLDAWRALATPSAASAALLAENKLRCASDDPRPQPMPETPAPLPATTTPPTPERVPVIILPDEAPPEPPLVPLVDAAAPAADARETPGRGSALVALALLAAAAALRRRAA